MPETLERRNRGNQQKGRRFELAVRDAFRAAGFRVETLLEADGYIRGWDLKITHPRLLRNVVIQCKATQRKSDLLAGLNEAREHNPDRDLFVCIHSWRRPEKQPEIRVAFSSDPTLAVPPSILDLSAFLVVLDRSVERGEVLTG